MIMQLQTSQRFVSGSSDQCGHLGDSDVEPGLRVLVAGAAGHHLGGHEVARVLALRSHVWRLLIHVARTWVK